MEHVHEWLYVSQPGPIEYGKFLAPPGDKLYRFCIVCDAKQALTPDGKIVAELEQQLQEARALLEEFISDESDGSAWSFSYDGPECVFCVAYDHQHAADCPMVKARAFLNKES